MVDRSVRVRDLVTSLGTHVKRNEDGDPVDMETNFEGRTIHRDELVEICDRFGLQVSGDDTVPDIRKKLREGGYTGGTEYKESESRFSALELFRLHRKMNLASRLEEHEVDIWDDVAKQGGTIYVDGEEYEVTDKSRGSPRTDQPYESYELYYFGQEQRLAILRNLDKDECSYLHSVILEKRVNDVPYRQWVKDEYVEDIETRKKVEA